MQFPRPLSSAGYVLAALCFGLLRVSAAPAATPLDQSTLPVTAQSAKQDGKHYLISYPDQALRVEVLTDGKSSLLFSAVPPKAEHPPLSMDESNPRLGGAAVWEHQLVCCLTRESAILLIDLRSCQITSRQALPDFPSPRAAAYDPQGRLWMFSGRSLAEITFTSDGHFNPIHHAGDFDAPEHLLIAADGKFYVLENGPQPALMVLSSQQERLRKVPLPEGLHGQALSWKNQQAQVTLANGQSWALAP